MTHTLYLAKSSTNTTSCSKCNGYGMVKSEKNNQCNHCYNPNLPNKYTVCCFCENMKNKNGIYKECSKCIGTGSEK